MHLSGHQGSMKGVVTSSSYGPPNALMTLFFDVRNLLEPVPSAQNTASGTRATSWAAAGHYNALIGLVKPPAVPVANLGSEQID